jgi:hypothetical protein
VKHWTVKRLSIIIDDFCCNALSICVMVTTPENRSPDTANRKGTR